MSIVIDDSLASFLHGEAFDECREMDLPPEIQALIDSVETEPIVEPTDPPLSLEEIGREILRELEAETRKMRLPVVPADTSSLEALTLRKK